MSLAKRKIEEIEEYRRIAFKAMIEIGALKTCDYHDDFYYNTYKYSDSEIYPIVTAKIKKEYGESRDYKLFHKQIAEILSYAAGGADECPFCEKLSKE